MDISKLVEDLENKASVGNNKDPLMEATWIDIIGRIGDFILSFLIIALVIIMPLIITLEVIYINFPVVRTEIIDKRIMVKGNGHVQKAMKITLHDAILSLKEANTSATGKSANLIYLRRKIKWIVIVSASLFIYLGGIDIIIGLVVNVFSGLIDVIIDAIF